MLLASKTVERMREMSKFSCLVQVLSDGECGYSFLVLNQPMSQSVNITGKTTSSSDLIPGDIVNIMAEQLALFPADMLLLSGDAIVNESMLTGESVPIGKVPIKDADLLQWREGGEIPAETAKGLLYTGTKIVRIRGVFTATEGEQALGLVVRTGMSLRC